MYKLENEAPSPINVCVMNVRQINSNQLGAKYICVSTNSHNFHVAYMETISCHELKWQILKALGEQWQYTRERKY